MRIHRPRHATIVAYLALSVAMGGTAVAATGGTFILGKSNKATTATSLTNAGTGTALSLRTKKTTTPPLKVSNSTKVAKLNADKVDGVSAVACNASSSARKRTVVATCSSNGRLPNNIISKAPDANKLDGIDSTRFLKTPIGMKVVAAGLLLGTGSGVTVEQTTGNFAVARTSAGFYSLTIDGVSGAIFTQFVGIASSPDGTADVDSASGHLLVVHNTYAGASSDGIVDFVIYQIG